MTALAWPEALAQDTYVTVHVGAGEPGTRGSWATWSGIGKWAEPAPSPEQDAAVLLVPDTGPLGLLTSWGGYVAGRVCPGLWTTTTTDGIGLWMVAAWD